MLHASRHRRLTTSLLLAASGALAAPLTGAPLAAQSAPQGRWTLEHEAGRDRVQITFRDRDPSHDSMWSFDIAPTELAGLSLAALDGAGDSASFRMARDAGTIAFTGRVGRGLGIGTYTFAPNAAFAADLARRGYGQPSDAEALRLALADVGTRYIARLDALHYERPTIAELVRLGEHGVTLDSLNDMASFGFNAGSASEVIRMRDHGLTSEYVRALRGTGYTDATAGELVRAIDHGVDAKFAAGFREAGYGHVPLETLVRLRDHGVTPSYARAARADGATPPSLEELVRRRDRGEP